MEQPALPCVSVRDRLIVSLELMLKKILRKDRPRPAAEMPDVAPPPAPAARPRAVPAPGTRTRKFAVVEQPPVLTRPISQACTASQVREPAYAYWCRAIRQKPRAHRKQWEFCYIAQALAVEGMLAPGRRGLGFGVGGEPLTELFAARGCDILATDQAPEEAERTGWIDGHQHASSKAALNRRKLCPPDLFEEKVTFAFADMNAIPDDIGTFDFIWSACALEHLGSIDAGKAFVLNSAALLKPGGMIVHTTEYNCSSNQATVALGGTVLFRRRDFEYMGRELGKMGLEVTFTFDVGDDPLDNYIDVPPYTSDVHLKLRLRNFATTSFGVIARKPR